MIDTAMPTPEGYKLLLRDV